MEKYTIELAGLRRELPFVDIGDGMAFASFVIISDTELISRCAPLLAEKIGTCDALITAEAKGIALAYEISRLLGLKDFIVARKSEKSYMAHTVSVPVHSITTAKEQVLLLDGADSEKIRGKKVCLLDDVVSTGESLTALENLVTKAGATVCAKACILAEGEASKRDDLLFLQELPLFRKTSEGGYEVLL